MCLIGRGGDHEPVPADRHFLRDQLPGAMVGTHLPIDAWLSLLIEMGPRHVECSIDYTPLSHFALKRSGAAFAITGRCLVGVSRCTRAGVIAALSSIDVARVPSRNKRDFRETMPRQG